MRATQQLKDGMLERMIPPGSRLRCAYETGLKGAGVIANEGWGSFLKKFGVYLDRNYMQPDLYASWIKENEDDGEDYLALVRDDCRRMKYRPRFSIIFPVFNTEKSFLTKAIDSVLNQAYDNWELCAVDGNSARPAVKETLNEYSKEEERIRVRFLPQNEGIAGNSNQALSLATGDFVAFLDHDDTLSPLALYEFSKMLNDDASIDIIYSDEDKIDTSDRRFDPFFKPGWSPDTLRCCNYVSHFLAVRRDLALEVGGFRKEFEGAQDYDFLLRAVEKAKKIRHTNKVLYHWRSHSGSIAANAWSKGYAHENGKKALQEHCKRLGGDVAVLDGKDPFRYSVLYNNYRAKPLASIVVASEGKGDFIQGCLKSIVDKSAYQNYEIVIVNAGGWKNEGKNGGKNGGISAAKLRELNGSGHPIRRLEYDGGVYNRYAASNFGARSCRGQVLIFLDERLEAVSPDWIGALIQHALREEIGAAGGLVMGPDERVMHAGLVMGLNGGADYICAGMTPEEVEANPTANLMVNYARNVSAVSASCLCVTMKKFLEAGGFDLRTAGTDAGVDLCLKLLGRGYRNIYTPFSILSCKDASFGKTPLAMSAVSVKSKEMDDEPILMDPCYSSNFDRTSRVPMIAVNPGSSRL